MKMTKTDKAYLDKIKLKYCEKFKVSETEFCERQFEDGLQWLKKNNFPEKVSYSAAFWGWFRIRITEEAERCILGETALSDRSLLFSMPWDVAVKIQRETKIKIFQTNTPQENIKDGMYMRYLRMEFHYLKELDRIKDKIREFETNKNII